MKKILLLALMALFSTAAIAQTRITGTVTSAEDQTPVSFATVAVKGNSNLITSTDNAGKFVLPNVPANAVLVVSFIGFTTQEVPVNNRTVINIVLSPDATALEEVMVVAYGTVKKGSYSGSAAVVKNEAIKDLPVSSIEQALVGNVPGMQVTSQSGQPGSMPQIRVRGIGSFNAGNQPLYVVDGVPVTSGDWSHANIVTSSMNFLDPSNIETITVLKDAAAASLYGSRAANGVILVTTKTGKQGKAISTFKASYGFSDFAVNNYPMVSEAEQEMLTREMVRNYADDTPSVWNNATYNFSKDEYVNRRTEVYFPARKPGYEYVDWRKKMFRKASAQNYEFNISGGGPDSKVFASVAYNGTQGVSLIAQMNRISANINASQKMSKAITVGGSIQYAITDQDGFQEGAGQRDNPWYSVVAKLTPRFAFKKPDGTYAHYGSESAESYDGTVFRNPYPDKDKQIANSKHTRALLRGWAEVTFIQGLTLKSIFNYDNVRVDDRFGWLVGHQYGEAYGKGYVGDRYEKINRIVSSTTLNYNKSFKNHNLAVMAGWEAESMKRQYTNLSGINFANYNLVSTYLAGSVRDYGTRNDEQAMLSFLSSLNYDYGAKYYLTATFRRDGSSKLGPENRWGNFWSLSGSWRLINESFLKSVDWLNDLKVRGSYGINATLPSGYYDWQTLYGYSRYGGDNSSNPSSYADRNLTWETNYTWNVALEGKLFDRFSFIAEYYSRTTKDLLLSASIPSITGFTSTSTNIGSMLNNGVELTLNVNILKKGNLKWDVGMNWSSLHNEVLALSQKGETLTSTPFIRKVGYSYYQYYTREYLGADPQTGLPQYYTNRVLESGELEKKITNTTSSALSAIIEGKTGLPKGFGGINTNLSYKNFSLFLLFNYQYGNYIWDGATGYIRTDGYSPYNNMSKDMLQRWQKPGDITDVPRPSISTQGRAYNSTAWIHKGDFLRLKNLTLSYNLPKEIISKVSLKSVRAYMSGTNLLTFSGLDFDPEVPMGGYVSFTLPAMKTLTFGLEISF